MLGDVTGGKFGGDVEAVIARIREQNPVLDDENGGFGGSVSGRLGDSGEGGLIFKSGASAIRGGAE